jgi:phosphoglycolate phosphatase
MTRRLAIFDCDGTLVDSGATIASALAESFHRHGRVEPCGESARRVVGLSLTEAMAALIPDSDPDEHVALADTYRDVFVAMRAAGRVEEPLYPGIVALLDRLQADGWLLGVATGKSDRGLRHCLTAHGLLDRFVTLQTADRHPSKPAPDMALAAMIEAGTLPADTLMIGDTAFDMGMAKAADIAAIGVTWGYHPESDLLAAGAQAIAHVPADIADIVDQWRSAAR